MERTYKYYNPSPFEVTYKSFSPQEIAGKRNLGVGIGLEHSGVKGISALGLTSESLEP